MANKKLTDKEEAFIQYYCTNGYNASRAAKDAGYSESSARQTGSENLSKPHIKKGIDKYKDDKSDIIDISMLELIEKARYMYNIAKDSGDLANMIRANDQLAKLKGAYIERVDMTTNQKLEYTMIDKIEKDI